MPQKGQGGHTGVHGDEDGTRGIEGHLIFAQPKSRFVLADRIQDALELCRDHRQHLHRNPVELIKAAPSAAGCEPLKQRVKGSRPGKGSQIMTAP